MLSYLNLPDIFYLGVYQPSTGECEGDFNYREYTDRIWKLKECNSLVIEEFANCISSNLRDDFDSLVVVPPHHCERNNSGIKILSQKITDEKKLIDATSCLRRYKNIDELSTGGDRSIEKHFQSIEVVNRELIKGKKLLLIDDVSTTGNSLKACQELLESAGAKSVKSFVLAKTTRSEKDLDFFQGQYNSIAQFIEEEFDSLEEQIDEETEQNHACTECKYEAGMQNLSEAFDSGFFLEENFGFLAFELEQSYEKACQKIENESAQNKSGIGCSFGWQMQALSDLHKFSFN